MAKILLSCQKGADDGAYRRALSPYGLVAAAHEDAQGDALVLGGGGDLSPRFYPYQGPLSRIRVEDEARDRMELGLIRRFLRKRKPILGICRGAQMLSAALGGTLVEDIGALFGENRHENTCHTVTLLPGSRLYAVLGRTYTVNSFHHQAILQPGRGLHTAAYAPDGLCEAVEHAFLPVLGVQWHPEKMADAKSAALFALFCACMRESR